MKQVFLQRMQDLLQDEYDAYIASLDREVYKGLSLNQAKCDIDFLKEQFPYTLEPSNFSSVGYRFDSSVKSIGNHWTHLAGLYYLQEPSASSVVDMLDIQEGDWVLDLCAAPGGKSSQIATKLNNTGFLVSNEFDSKRANILLSNLERMGVTENMITNAPVDKLCPLMRGWFDKVLVDAPCSGEGMMKKHELAKLEWSKENVDACATRQLFILNEAVQCVKEGGLLVYSTCTYAQEENEGVVYEFLKQHPEMELVDCLDHVKRTGIVYEDLDVSKLRRIFPMDGGEGHFMCRMRKKVSTGTSSKNELKSSKVDVEVSKFVKGQLGYEDAYYLEINNKIYMKKTPFIQLKNINILRQGVYVGEMIKKRLEPAHHFYLASRFINDYKQVVELTDDELPVYLSGNVISRNIKGYVCVMYKKIPLGFGKGDGMMIKNKYPKGLRIMVR
ncbi:MAG: RsmF rRNA methyltransferase first C-terminal domain-containing protein [Erysipelotrichaceae bacterium]|nr:RsmF rRNA methyltransferase first C-terminal domain-containing protein [Erysipelotrichaceae bacterium]